MRLNVSLFIVIGLPFFLKPGVFAQNVQLYGHISEASTGEAVPEAFVYDSLSAHGTTTNNYGYYSLWVKKGWVSLYISHMGYQKKKFQLFVRTDTLLSVGLENYSLGEVIIEQSIGEINPMGTVKLSIENIKKIPMLAGEPDILKALTLTPGVSAGAEGTTGLYVRGGTPDQNQILLDDAVVYNAAHLFGFVSVFNTDAVKNVKLIKGGFPARYGGRLSSVIDITMKEGSNEKVEGQAAIGLLGSRFSIGGPIKKGTSSFFIGARASYLTLFLLPLRYQYKNGRTNTYFNYFLYDLNAKVNYRIDEKSQIFISFYSGDDNYVAKEGYANNKSDFNLNWGNVTASLRYKRILSPSLFSKLIILHSRYYYKIKSEMMGSLDSLQNVSFFNSTSTINDWTGKLLFQWAPGLNHDIEFGSEATLHHYAPSIFNSSYSALNITNSQLTGREYAFFAEDKWIMINRLQLHAGLRFSIFDIEKKTFYGTEPRFSANYDLTKAFALRVAYSKMQQYIHLLSGNGTGLSNDLWVPATKRVPPQFAHQWSIGTVNKLNNSVNVTLEGFYKKLFNVIEYKPNSNLLLSLENTWEDMIDKGGLGQAYGGELLVDKRAGPFTGWMAYTLSWNYRKFDNINKGQQYPAKYDRRHNFSITSQYQINKHWNVSTTWVYATGPAVTLPVAIIKDLDGNALPVYEKRNNSRMPSYHRLDVGFNNTWKTKRNREATFSFGVYNAYNRVNAFYVNFSINQFGNGPSNLQSERVGVFQLFPYFSYSIKF